MNEIEALAQTSVEDEVEYDIYEVANAIQMIDTLSLAEVLWENPTVASKLQKAIDVIEQDNDNSKSG